MAARYRQAKSYHWREVVDKSALENASACFLATSQWSRFTIHGQKQRLRPRPNIRATLVRIAYAGAWARWFMLFGSCVHWIQTLQTESVGCRCGCVRQLYALPFRLSKGPSIRSHDAVHISRSALQALNLRSALAHVKQGRPFVICVERSCAAGTREATGRNNRPI